MIWEGRSIFACEVSEISSHVILKEGPSVKQGGMDDKDDDEHGNDDDADDDVDDEDGHVNDADKL